MLDHGCEVLDVHHHVGDAFTALGGDLDPRGGMSAAEYDRVELESRLGIMDAGLAGISFHTRFQGVSLDSRWITAAVERLAGRGTVPIVHAMDETPEESLWKLAALARAVPDTPILTLDPFCSFEATRQCFFLAELAPNIIFDTSLSYNFDFIEDFVRRFGAERVAFGTDLYSWPVGKRVSHLLAQIVESKLAHRDKALILGGNARTLFGLDGGV